MLALGDLTFTDLRDHLAAHPDTIALVPVGSTEAHGPHLPLATDVIIAEGLGKRLGVALEKTGRQAAMAPAIAYALTEYAAGFAGTVGVSGEAARAYLIGVCRGLGKSGFKKVCLVNAHLEPDHVLILRGVAREATTTGLSVLAPETARSVLRAAYLHRYGNQISHAGAYETALILAEKPELVREERRSQLLPNKADLVEAMKAGKRTFLEAGGPDAYFGNPATASVGEGEWLYERLVALLVEAVDAAWSPAA